MADLSLYFTAYSLYHRFVYYLTMQKLEAYSLRKILLDLCWFASNFISRLHMAALLFNSALPLLDKHTQKKSSPTYTPEINISKSHNWWEIGISWLLLVLGIHTWIKSPTALLITLRKQGTGVTVKNIHWLQSVMWTYIYIARSLGAQAQLGEVRSSQLICLIWNSLLLAPRAWGIKAFSFWQCACPQSKGRRNSCKRLSQFLVSALSQRGVYK